MRCTLDSEQICVAFGSERKIAEGNRIEVARKVKRHIDKHPNETLLIFDARTSAPVEMDFRGTLEDVLQRLEAAASSHSGPGRPKLGVISREIGLLPEHWEWLSRQRGGASGTLRRLVDEARKNSNRQDQQRAAQDATYKFMTVMAGNLPHFEEALRAFYARNLSLFETLIAPWPKDIRSHILQLAAGCFD
jgi:uncharacterized protein